MNELSTEYIASPTPRARWNVLDLLSVFGGRAVPATLFVDVDMQACVKLKKEFDMRGLELTETAMMIKAIAMAQRKHPSTKAFSLPFLKLVTPEKIVAGFTVEREVQGEPAVFFGTIESPETKTLSQIMAELKQYVQLPVSEHPVLREQFSFSKMPKLARWLVLAAAVWNPAVRLRYMPATFGLTSLGKFGVGQLFGPTVCTSTFGIGQVKEAVLVRDGKVCKRSMMTLSLFFDHVVIDGAPVAAFLADVRSILENGLIEKTSKIRTIVPPAKQRKNPASAA